MIDRHVGEVGRRRREEVGGIVEEIGGRLREEEREEGRGTEEEPVIVRIQRGVELELGKAELRLRLLERELSLLEY